MRTRLLLLTLPALILVAACGDDEKEATGGGPARTATSVHTAAASPTADPLATVCAENPDPATVELVQVDKPTEGDEISSPVTVRGRVVAFEAVFQITIFDEDGKILADQSGMSAEGATLATFEEQVPFSVTSEMPACLWVYQKSARDGSPDNVLQVPVRLVP